MNKTGFIVFICLLPGFLRAQSLFNDPAAFSILKPQCCLSSGSYYSVARDTASKAKHSPKKAAIMSAILPGAGQAYNRKFWKIPVVYALMGTTTWFMLKNSDSMLKRQNALKAMLDNDPNTVPDPLYASQTVEQLKADRNYYRANRDYSIIALAAFYVINIVDATVDAHFYKFNIDKPLAQQKTRHWYASSYRVMNHPTFGVAYRF